MNDRWSFEGVGPRVRDNQTLMFSAVAWEDTKLPPIEGSKVVFGIVLQEKNHLLVGDDHSQIRKQGIVTKSGVLTYERNIERYQIPDDRPPIQKKNFFAGVNVIHIDHVEEGDTGEYFYVKADKWKEVTNIIPMDILKRRLANFSLENSHHVLFWSYAYGS